MQRLAILLICGLQASLLIPHLRWGLPTREADPYLFGEAEPWSGQRIAELLPTGVFEDARAPADVDVNPRTTGSAWDCLTDDEAERAEIIARYRLYTEHPDEMLVLRALRRMNPETGDFDPDMYQYGGAYLYPLGAFLRLAGTLGLVDLRTDLAWYLDNPERIGDLYAAARVWTLLWALLGVVAAYLIGLRLSNAFGGVVAALLFTLVPLTFVLAHEAKPHLPALVLTLLCAHQGLRLLECPGFARAALLAIFGGLAVGTALTAAAAALIVLLAALLAEGTAGRRIARAIGCLILATIVFAAVNPYLSLHLWRGETGPVGANLANTAAMFTWHPAWDGLTRAGALVLEAVGPVLLGVSALTLFSLFGDGRARAAWLLLLPAAAVFATVAFFATGQPVEFARFLALPATVLALAVAAELGLLAARQPWAARAAAVVIVGATALSGWRYRAPFDADLRDADSRTQAARWLHGQLALDPQASVGVRREPAPYAVPPLDFAHRLVYLLPRQLDLASQPSVPEYLIDDADYPPAPGTTTGDYRLVAVFPPEAADNPRACTPLTWANRPILIYQRLSYTAP